MLLLELRALNFSNRSEISAKSLVELVCVLAMLLANDPAHGAPLNVCSLAPPTFLYSDSGKKSTSGTFSEWFRRHSKMHINMFVSVWFLWCFICFSVFSRQKSKIFPDFPLISTTAKRGAVLCVLCGETDKYLLFFADPITFRHVYPLCGMRLVRRAELSRNVCFGCSKRSKSSKKHAD